MKKAILMSALTLSAAMVAPIYADTPPVLNTVQYQIQVKKFVNTHTAKVVLNINASAQQSEVATLQKKIMSKLSSLVTQVDWHVSNLQMSQDQSGLQTLQLLVSARVPQVEITNLKKKIKEYSQEGQQYKIQSIDFAPSLSEYQHAKMQLRDQVYKDIKQELKTLNQEFSKSHYFVHQVSFNENAVMPSPMSSNVYMARVGSASVSGVSVGREVMLSAKVTFANVVK